MDSILTDKEFDGYLVLIRFNVKKEKILALKKILKIFGKANIQKERNVRTFREFYFK